MRRHSPIPAIAVLLPICLILSLVFPTLASAVPASPASTSPAPATPAPASEAIAAPATSGSPADAGAPSCRVTLLEPRDDQVLYGPTVLRAAFDCPRGAAPQRALFLVDGREVAQAPAGGGAVPREVRAAWDAGGSFRPRVVEVRLVQADGRAASAVIVTPGSAFQESLRVPSTPIDLVEMSVSVVDRNGRAVPGLGPEDFVVREEGKAQRLDAVRPETRPLSVTILVDASESTRGVWPMLRRAAPVLARALGPRDAAKVIAFNGPAYLVQDFTRDPGALADAMAAFDRWGGGTSLYDTLAAAGVELAWGRDGRQAVVVLSDGVDTLSRIDLPRLRAYLRRTEVVVSAFLLRPEPPSPPPGVRFFERDMRILTDETGGVLVRLRDLSGLEEAFRELASDLQNRYYIAWHSDRAVRAGAWRSVKVSVRRPGATVRFRRGAVARRDIADYLLEDLRTGSAAARRKAAEWLGGMGAGSEPLLAALGDRAPEVRAAAALALGRMREPRALGPLADLLGDPETGVRRAASEALRTFGPVAVPELLRLLEGDARPAAARFDEVRLHAIETLAAIGDPRGITTLERLARPPPLQSSAPGSEPARMAARPDPRARLWALSAFGDLGLPEALPILARAAGDRDSRVRQAGLAALGRLAVPDAVPVLLRSIADPDRETRALAYRVLAGLLVDGGERLAGRLDTVPVHRRERLLDDGLAPLLEAARAVADRGGAPAGVIGALRAAAVLVAESRYPERLIAMAAPDPSDPLRAALEERRRFYATELARILDAV
jgi:VWFA-related protein